MRTLNRICAFVLCLSLLISSSVTAAVDTTVNITKNEPLVILSDTGERIFDIQYVFGIDFQYESNGLDIVLVLDRSNSMLIEDPSTGLPVADAVWKAANQFVSEVYAAYPQSSIAILPFGTNAVKMDNWKFAGNLEGTLSDIEDVYDYRDLNTEYTSNYRHFKYNGYRFAWENWQISDGATNIKEAFEASTKTAELRTIRDKSTNESVVILFTDGVATQGGSNSQKNLNYPTAHNSNTIAAYTAAEETKLGSEIITVGYFEGISLEETKAVARDTLERSNSIGFFEASETSQLTGIFGEIVKELNYIGTGAAVVETVQDEFEIVEGSISPADYTLSTDEQGRQVIIWELGNVIKSDYTFGYQVKVKDDVYPTGSGTVEIPINEIAMLYYTDLNGLEVSEPLGQSSTIIPPRDNQPLINFDVTYGDDRFGYLVGDEIEINHGMSFINEAPFDYRQIDVNRLTKEAQTGNLAAYLEVTQESIDAGWSIDGNNLNYDINQTNAVTGTDNLEWNLDVPVSVKAIQTGTFQLTHMVDYVLTNSVGLTFDFVTLGNDPDAVDIKEGQAMLNLVDDYGLPVTDISVTVDGEESAIETNSDGYVVVRGITSGTHTIAFELPSGYELITSGDGITMDEKKIISFDAAFSYENPVVTKNIEFERLKVKGIKITTRDDNHWAIIDGVSEQTPAKMKFTLTRPLIQMSMRMIDDYDGADHSFTLDSNGASADVRNSSGVLIPGFVMNGQRLEYSGSELPVDDYTAYGILTPPDFAGGVDYDYEVDVDEIITRENGDPLALTSEMTSVGLDVALTDTEGPVIVAVHDEEESTLNLINQDITITDKTKIVTYEVYDGILTYEELMVETEQLPYEVIRDADTIVELDGDIPVTLSIDTPGDITASGAITIYAVDAFGNYTVEVIEYEDTEVNQLLDEDLV